MIALDHERTRHHLYKPVLVLNSSYEPINVCAARRALVLVLKGVAAAEEHGWILGRIQDPFGHRWEIGRPLGAWPPTAC